jgi:hypothetical protein
MFKTLNHSTPKLRLSEAKPHVEPKRMLELAAPKFHSSKRMSKVNSALVNSERFTLYIGLKTEKPSHSTLPAMSSRPRRSSPKSSIITLTY